jgi:hypothetical protein
MSPGGGTGDSCFHVVLLDIHLLAAFLEIHVSWDATPCWLRNSYRRFEGS